MKITPRIQLTGIQLTGIFLLICQSAEGSLPPKPLNISDSQIQSLDSAEAVVRASYQHFEVSTEGDHQTIDSKLTSNDYQVASFVRGLNDGLNFNIWYKYEITKAASSYEAGALSPAFQKVNTSFIQKVIQPGIIYSPSPGVTGSVGLETISYTRGTQTTNVEQVKSDEIVSKNFHNRPVVGLTKYDSGALYSISWAQMYRKTFLGSNFSDPMTVKALAIWPVTTNFHISFKVRHRAWSALRSTDKNLWEYHLGGLFGYNTSFWWGLILTHQPEFFNSGDNATISNIARNKINFILEKNILGGVKGYMSISYLSGSGRGQDILREATRETAYDKDIKLESTMMDLGISQRF